MGQGLIVGIGNTGATPQADPIPQKAGLLQRKGPNGGSALSLAERGRCRLPLVVRGQGATGPVIGYLAARAPEGSRHLVAAFRQGLAESGYIDGQNLIIEERWALGQVERLLAVALELARKPVSVIVSTGGENAALIVKAATSIITIIFASGSDPVEMGPRAMGGWAETLRACQF
jgi:hypothetical protein